MDIDMNEKAKTRYCYLSRNYNRTESAGGKAKMDIEKHCGECKNPRSYVARQLSNGCTAIAIHVNGNCQTRERQLPNTGDVDIQALIDTHLYIVKKPCLHR